MKWWFSCNKFTVFVETDDDSVIAKTAPVVRKFVGQPLSKLEAWFRGFGGFEKAGFGGKK